MKEPSHRVSIAFFVTTLVLIMGLKAEAQTKTNTKTLTLGVVFQGPREPLEATLSPLWWIMRPASSLPTAETKGMVVVAPTPGQMMKLLEEKRVDFYMESPYPTYLINRLGAAKLLLRRWKGGIGEYRSLIFTNKDSGIARLEDLRGKIIAFEDPGSTSGYFLPKLFLLKKGFSVVEKPSAGAKVSSREIGYIFADTYKNIANLVLAK